VKSTMSGTVALATVVLLGACAADGPAAAPAAPAALPMGADRVELDPADFSVEITNPYWPMDVGDRWVFEEIDGEGGVQRVEVTVLDETRTVAAGIEARVVHDLVTQAGSTAEYENGKIVSTAGSWEAGLDGAQAGIVIPAEPEAGLAYRQEYLAGEAEDEALVLSVAEQVEAPTGTYTGALLTRDTTPLQPEISELKFYAPGVGPVLILQTSGGAAREALVETTRIR
jgi:hypothetical protein